MAISLPCLIFYFLYSGQLPFLIILKSRVQGIIVILMQESKLDLIEKLAIDEELDEEITTERQSSKAGRVKEDYHSKDRILKGTNPFSQLFFLWISKLLTFGKYCPIETEDLPKLHDSMHPRIQFQNLHNIMADIPRSSKKGWTLLKAIAKAYCSSVVFLGLLSLVITIFTMTAPILTHQIITYVKNSPEEREASQGLWLIMGIVAITIGKAIMQSHLYYRFAVFGFNLSNTLSLLIYEKSLKYPALCQKKYSIPEIINYSQVDAQRMTNMGVQLTSVLYTPLQIIIGIWLMYSYIGVSFAFGMGTMILMIAVTFFLAKRIAKVNEVTLKRKDERMKNTEEMLDIIRFIKINAFEKYFYRKVDQKRSAELQSNRKRGVLEVSVTFLYFLSCPLIIFLTFLAYVQFGNQIDSTIAFSTIMIFNILQNPLRQFPSALSSLIQMSTSIARIEEFLLAKEISMSHLILNNEEETVAIRIQNGTFGWGVNETNDKPVSKKVQQYRKSQALKINQSTNEESSVKEIHSEGSSPRDKSKSDDNSLSFLEDQQKDEEDNQGQTYLKALKQINLTIEKGRFVMILGDIGSGKSSFLLSILNEMNNSKRSSITINGSVAYAAQKPWIMHGTVRDNITFCKVYEKRRFNEVLGYSSLTTDLKLLVKGQFTEIGEKGVNLSGGQKARISLARAIYSQRDILLLDDIISAVDVHVAQFIIKEAILGYLKGKTIVLATHAAKFSEYADEIIILKKGVIVRKGTFRDLRQTQEFKQIYQIEMKKQKESEQSPEDKQISKDQKKVKETFNLILQHKKSKKSNASSTDKKTQSFAERAIEELIVPEDHKRGSIGGQVVKEYVRLNGGLVFVLVVVGAMTGWLCCSIFSNIQMQLWCKDEAHDNMYLYIYMILSGLSSFCAFLRAYTLVLSGFKQGEKVHKKIVQSLLYASLNEFYLRVPVGRIMNRLTKDLRELDETIGSAMGNFLTNLFSLLGTLSICIYGSTPYMIIPVVIVIFLCNKLRQYYMKTQREVLRIEAKTNSPIVSGFVSTINGLSTIRAYKVEEEFMENQIRKVEVNKGARITREALESWFAFRLSLLSFGISIISIVFALINTGMEPALVGLLLSYAFNLNDDIISLTFSWANLQTRMISVERIHNFMQIEPEQSYERYCLNWSEAQEGFQSIIQHGQIQYKDVSLRYRPDLPYALKNLSFRIRAGEKVGVVGRTGAGKSTIFASLLRLVEPCSGEIFLDDVNISSIFVKNLRNAITMIDQEPTLIKGTFRENLDIKNIYTDDQLYALLEECNLYDIVMQKDGLDQVIDNNSLSAGEKQLLCICRAFLKKSKIVIIDEATANIDMKNDQIIQKVIKEKFKNSTVITIAHRLSTLKTSDKIIVMGQGRVLEFGSPIELQQREGIYAEMVEKNLNEYFV